MAKSFLIVCLVLGCSAPEAPCQGDGHPCPEHLASTFVVSDDLGPELTDSFVRAVDEWNAADPQIDLRVVVGKPANVRLVSDLHDEAHEAEYDPGKERLLFRVGTSRRDLHSYALHEVGHWLGLGHSFDIGDAMHPVVPVDDLSEADIVAFKALY